MICCSKNSLMWVFVSEWTVLNKFLDFASEVLFHFIFAHLVIHLIRSVLLLVKRGVRVTGVF